MNHYYLKRLMLLCSLFCIILCLQAQAPSGYYSGAKGKTGAGLKTALFKKISNHTALSYDALWNAYKTTDVRADGTIWDMYSDITHYNPSKDHGGSYGKEGDMFNREHSFPKSWFSNATPMYTDLFHLYPTDGYVNGRRSNYPFGETNSPTYTSHGGFSKLGPSSVSGYSGTVFEPNDEYKGDFARTYFYMATAYEDKIAGWSSPMLSKNSYPAYANWALTMLLRWAHEDPVSQKEIDRNNAVYTIQHNRNPYIDYPGLEQYVWGDSIGRYFDPDNYGHGGGVTPPSEEVETPTFYPAAGVVSKGTNVTITSATEGASIYYIVNGGSLQSAYGAAHVTINEATTIQAYAMLGEVKSQSVVANYTIASELPEGNHVYTLVTNAANLSVGNKVLIVCPSQNLALSASDKKSAVRKAASVSISDDKIIETEVGAGSLPYELTLGGGADAWTFYDAVEDIYLSLLSDKNALNYSSDAKATNAQWTIRISSSGEAVITNNQYSSRSIRYNVSSPRFSTYTNGQRPVELFVKTPATGLSPVLDHMSATIKVYDVQGRYIFTESSFSEALKKLKSGLYIVNGQKILIR